MNYNDISKKLDKERRIQLAKKRADYLVTSTESQILDLRTYLTCPEDERLEKLMKLFNKINPNWRTSFNEKEEEKPLKMRTHLKLDKDGKILESMIEEAQEDSISESANSLFIANKIAHECQNTMKKLVESILYEKSKILTMQKDYKTARKLESLNEDSFEFENILLAFRRYFDLSKNSSRISTLRTEEQLDKQKAILGQYKIDISDFNRLQDMGFVDIMKLSYNAFAIKDYEISHLITELEERDDIDYGMAVKTDNEGNPKENIFVINLPYYGQFSVHLKMLKHIQAQKNHPYSLDEIHELETIMLTSEISPNAKGDLDRGASISESKLMAIAKKDARYALYLALKTGYEKDTIRDIFNTSKSAKKSHDSEDMR